MEDKKPQPISITSDGRLLFAPKGNPPTNIPGYTQAPGNPWIWIPDFAEDCKYRTVETRVKPCKELSAVFVCQLLKIAVNQVVCNSCDKAET